MEKCIDSARYVGFATTVLIIQFAQNIGHLYFIIVIIINTKDKY